MFRRNCDPELAERLHRYVRCVFDMDKEPPEVGYKYPPYGDSDWEPFLFGNPEEREDALKCLYSDIVLLTDEARLYITPFLLLEEFQASDDYGADSAAFILREDRPNWLSIYSPLQLSCLAFYVLMPASRGCFFSRDVWKAELWCLPLSVHCGIEPLDLDIFYMNE